ncbi:MAG: KH domain-containing protein [Acidobacteriota bacterium]|nr:KH domain-containing protein [Acidobacteriota bacterium]
MVVVIKTQAAEECASFSIDVHPDDVGKIIGRQGRNAKSLRIILSAIGKKRHRRYAIDVREE